MQWTEGAGTSSSSQYGSWCAAWTTSFVLNASNSDLHGPNILALCAFSSCWARGGMCQCFARIPSGPFYCFWVSLAQFLFELALNSLHVWLILDHCPQALGVVLTTQKKSINASVYLTPGRGTLGQRLVGEETESPVLYLRRETTLVVVHAWNSPEHWDGSCPLWVLAISDTCWAFSPFLALLLPLPS